VSAEEMLHHRFANRHIQ